MISYKINDEFSHIKELILNLPNDFDDLGKIILNNRNVIKRIDTGNDSFVVKYFRGMYFFNRVAYSLFRRSKASRSYRYSLILKEKGIATPPPVAWINTYTFGLLSHSYFINLYFNYKTLQQTVDDPNNDANKAILLKNLAAFTLKLHTLGIYHNDYSTGNILIIPTAEGHNFALLDLNRVKFQKINYKNGLMNFSKLGLDTNDINTLIRNYAILSGESPELSTELFWANKKRLSALRSFRKKMRRYTVTPIEKMFAK